MTGVERSDRVESFYKVGIEITAQVLNQTRTQETTVLVSRDGKYIISGQPKDIDNPQPPQPEPAVSPPDDEEVGNQTQ
ncbi:MAG: hypothetical protein ABEK10_01935 [Candidatus Nanosalina sp.]